MALTENLFNDLAKNSLLLISLHGVRTVLEKQLGLKDIQISTDETVKREIERKASNHEDIKFPYAYISLSEIIGVKDQNSNRNIQRLGIPSRSGAMKATTRKGYLFPINVGMELKYIDDKPERAMVMAETFVILSMIGGLSFRLTVSEDISFDVRIEVPENLSIPLADTSSTQSPSGIELSAQLVIHTYSGFFRNVAAVNSGNPILDMQIEMNDDIDLSRG